MVSTSLAAQLAKGASLNSSLLVDRSRRKHAESYLFSAKEADQHDYYSIHALGVNGLSKLKTLDAKFSKYEGNLFSDAARGLDRTLQSEAQNAELDRTLASFLKDLGPYLLEAPTSKAIEWIVRRFRVNEFNVDAVMGLFLPYHETAHFAKVVSILHVKESSMWSFLSPLKASAKALPRSMLVDEMANSRDLARFVLALLPEALEAGRTYRTLTGFTASVTLDYLARMKKIDEAVMAFVLPGLLRSFAPDSDLDCSLAGYVSLSALSQHCRFSPQALRAIIAEMVKGQQHLTTQQMLPFLVAVVGPQDRLEDFDTSLTDSILGLPEIVNGLPNCLHWVGAEKLVLPLLPNLLKRASEEVMANLLNSLSMSPSVQSPVIERATQLLLDNTLRSSDPPNTSATQLLTVVFQRHGSVFSEISSKLLAAIEGENDRQTLETILRSVTLPQSSTNDSGKWILSSNTADVGSRVIAVRELVKALASGVAEESRKDMYDALQARVADTNAAVIETLYSDPDTILPILSNKLFIDAVSTALAAPDIPRSVLRLHFTFVVGKFYDHNPDFARIIFERIYLPFLLFTKPRQKTTATVWQSLKDSKLAQYDLLRGCTDIVFAASVTDGSSRSVEEMAGLNLAVINCIAKNIVASNEYPHHLDTLLSLMGSTDVYTSNVCYLILRSLLVHLSGEHQVDAASRILSSMKLQSLDDFHRVVGGTLPLQDAISEDALIKSVVLKPSSNGTKHRLQVAILALLPVVQQPVGSRVNWLGDEPLASSDMHGMRFVELAHAIYTLTNSSSSAQSLSTSLLKALFVNLREQSLLFLAGVWTASILSDGNSITLPHVALFHAVAFLRAQVADADRPQDFQVILPSLLIALRSKQRTVRSAAMDCIAVISQSSGTASPTVYALDTVYGSKSDDLQYLEWSDLGHYVSSLAAHREHFINDSEYLAIFNQEILRKTRSDSKKEAGYKYRVLCFILSHIAAWSSVRARIMLLETLRNIHHIIKLQLLLPLIQSIVSSDQAHRHWNDEDNSPGTIYLQLLLEVYDETAAPELTEPGSGSWITFVRLVRFAFNDGAAPLSVRKIILQQLCSGLSNSLTMDLKREICIVLIESAAVSSDSHTAIKEAMVLFLNEPALIMSLLAHFQPVGKDTSQRATKKPKLIPDVEVDAELSLRPMIVLVEILVAQVMPGSVELLSGALDTLSRICHIHSSQSDANYLMQLLMSMLESIVTSISETTALVSNVVRMEVLVELLRVSDNPQTFNQALLLIANLARLAPEFVMQNVMPVFTFMGSNVFHRDDTYSFRVVQKTIDSIVPVVIKSLEAKHPGRQGLQLASREFLRIFTDAATHVPRHRRTQFFNHLVEALGRDEFLVSICLLLVDKAANRVVRKKPGETASALGLPLSILQAHSKGAPFTIIEQLLQETTRLLTRITDSDSVAQDAFLEPSQDGDEASSTATKRQIQAIVMFVDLVLQQSSRKSVTADEPAIQGSVQLLLGLANLDIESTTSPEFLEVSRAAVKALGRLLHVISATEFASTIGAIMASNNDTVEIGAMNLLASRIANIAPKTRQDISPTIIKIVEHICKRFKTSTGVSVFRSSLNALRAIAQTADSREVPALTKALPHVLEVATAQKDVTTHALKCILALSAKIGPRILPFFHDVVEFCTGVLHDSQPGVDDVEKDAQAVLIALLSSISQFWSIDELVRLSELSLGSQPVSLSIRKTMAKRIPAKQLLPALFRLWSESAILKSPSWSVREAFFNLLKRVVRGAPRDDIHDRLRDIFKLFLEAFDMCNELDRQEMEEFESTTIAGFVDVVTKLNEAAFKPIFRRLFDWAFNDAADKQVDRQITFARLLTALIKLLKGLIMPYMVVVLAPLTELLNSYRTNQKQSGVLWLSAVNLFHTSLTFDEGAFWRADRLRGLIPTFVAQVEVCPSLSIADSRQALKICLGAVVDALDDDPSLKTLNLELLMQTRSDDAQVRLFALECSEHLWGAHTEKLAGFTSDVVTFIAECAEDEHDEVAKAARTLKRTVERKCGSLDVLMQ